MTGRTMPTPPAPRRSTDARPATERPRAPGEFTFGALAVTGVVVLALGSAATSGEPALGLLAAFGTALLVLGVIGPNVVLARVAVDLGAPADATVGREVAVEVEIRREPHHGSRRRGRAAQPAQGAAPATCTVRVLDPPSEWHATRVGGRGVIRWRPPRRGVYATMRVEVRSAWPFGVFLRRRVFVVTLSDMLHVAPAPVDVGYRAGAVGADGHAASVATRSDGDTVRSVRPYIAGDSIRRIHWPSTARAGELMTRELEPPASRGLVLKVCLAPEPSRSEPAASRALGLGIAVLHHGDRLVVATCERGGDVVAPVVTQRELGRRLARAVPGEPSLGATSASLGRPLAGLDVEEVR